MNCFSDVMEIEGFFNDNPDETHPIESNDIAERTFDFSMLDGTHMLQNLISCLGPQNPDEQLAMIKSGDDSTSVIRLPTEKGISA